MSSWDYYPKEFSSYEEYIKYLKEQGLAIEASQGLAIEAPEKIVLQEPTKVRTERLYDNDVEYVQTDAFIEKAICWIDYNNRDGGCNFDGWEKDFKKYMKENKSMKDKEMAELLAGAYQRQYHHNTYPELSDNSEFVTSKEEIKEACMYMAEWKNQQAIEYLYKNIQSLLKDYGISEPSADIATQLFLVNFKKAMEE